MAGKGKTYVVWTGRVPGIYSNWEACKAQVEGFENARYKAFESAEEAKKAFSAGCKWTIQKQGSKKTPQGSQRPAGDFLTVDAACSGNPGQMEYRGVYPRTGQEIFHLGPFEDGTNNIGEFLAIVHALALQTSRHTNFPIYSDSANAITWVRKKKCNTKLEPKSTNAPIFDLIERAESWLETHEYAIPVLKWETSLWGEIPADFGRK
ncbi:MAG: ribonuclease H family protein [Bacteroidota bacterium]|nr:ribonuclease H family protein [Bacteroidota bacterium]